MSPPPSFRGAAGEPGTYPRRTGLDSVLDSHGFRVRRFTTPRNDNVVVIQETPA